MRTKFPQCTKCKTPIDPNKDKFRVTNLEEAKYGRSPIYAHEACPSRTAESEHSFEETMADIVLNGPGVAMSGSGGIKPR